MSSKIVVEKNPEAVQEHVNGHRNGQLRNEILSENDSQVSEEQTGNPQNVQMNWELLRQFRMHGVTVAFPVDFADAISAQRRQKGKLQEAPLAQSDGDVA
jgi:hypothetical protein